MMPIYLLAVTRFPQILKRRMILVTLRSLLDWINKQHLKINTPPHSSLASSVYKYQPLSSLLVLRSPVSSKFCSALSKCHWCRQELWKIPEWMGFLQVSTSSFLLEVGFKNKAALLLSASPISIALTPGPSTLCLPLPRAISSIN